MRAVLKYSLTWVIIPSATVQAWTQAMLRAVSQPSTRTVEPKAAVDWGTNRKVSAVESPVSMRIKNWCEGGPWNHHSRSAARILATAAESPELRASYSASTSRLLLESASEALAWELASSRKRFRVSVERKTIRESELAKQCLVSLFWVLQGDRGGVYIGRLRRDVCDPVRPMFFGVGFVGVRVRILLAVGND